MTKCDCFRERDWEYPFGYDRCYGTKEIEACECMGYEKYCDFYPEKREKAKEKELKETMAKRWWIDVKELLPAIGRMVNVRNSHTTQVARLAADGQFYAQYNHQTIRIDGVTHWAVIPDLSYEV